jgi:hypothetical protein
VVVLTSVERMGFSFPGLAARSHFRLRMPFECINWFEKEVKGFSGNLIDFKIILTLLAIALQ